MGNIAYSEPISLEEIEEVIPEELIEESEETEIKEKEEE